MLYKVNPNDSIELERVFIIDFYLVFPSALSTIDFPKGFKKIKNVILNNNYS
ncbi:ABC-three component system middle component 5, partial [Acinetobacter radioresistens]|uniref:ABC-three component system middle component 5 n=1 Tax=Acinetobacter radioresistens TaxID=40216 RepID=UPI0035A2553C